MGTSIANTLTIKLALPDLTTDQQALLKKLSTTYVAACNYVSEYVFTHQFELNSNVLMRRLYSKIRRRFHLKSQMATNVFRTVTKRYQWQKRQFLNQPKRYYDPKNARWIDIARNLADLKRPLIFQRRQIDLVVHKDYQLALAQRQVKLHLLPRGAFLTPFRADGFLALLNQPHLRWGTAKLLQVKGHWFLNVLVTFETSQFQLDQVKHVVGIDRGLNFLMTTFDEKQRTQFFAGRSIMARRTQFFKQYQQLIQKGSPSALRRLHALQQKESRWILDVNHQMAKQLLKRYGCQTLFVMEALADLDFSGRTVTKTRGLVWPFDQFEAILTYQAQLQQCQVITVNADYTSQRCPRCGMIKKASRKHDLHLYQCLNCGYQSNDDRIGAMNIYQLGTQYVSGNLQPHFQRLINMERR